MRRETYTDAAGLARIAPSWQALADACPSATVFQSYEWNTTWWRHYGRVPGRRLWILSWWQDDHLVGLAPMMTGWWHGLPVRRTAFLGMGASDYHDILALPGQEDAVAEAFYMALKGRVADLSQLRAGGLLRERFPSPDTRFKIAESAGEACPFLPLAGDWDSMLRAFGKKTRSNIGYYDRAIRKVFDVEIGYVTDPDALNDEMARLFALHQRRWNQRWLPGVFSGQRVQAFHQDAARSLLARDMLRLFTLKLDGETQAALYCFASHDRLCYYQAGFEPTFAKWSLGTTLTAHAIQTAIAEGRTVFDFLRGDEPYKQKWTQTQALNRRRLLLPARSPSAPLARTIFEAEMDVERHVKAFLRRKG